MSDPLDSPSPLEVLAAFTGKPVSHYEELLDIMREEDRVELFPSAVSRESGLSLDAVRALLRSKDLPVQ